MKTIPRLRFAQLPTPVEPLPRLSAYLGGVQLFIKRDDQTGLAFGGNKTRKLEFLIAEAQAHGARTLVTAGAVQSNHCRQTAAAAARFGLDCLLVLSGENEEIPSGNLLLDHLFGAQAILTTQDKREKTLQEVFESAWEEGKRPYLIPYGGSNRVGAAAYLFALRELMDQGVDPDWIIFPTSSGGTQAGLVLGQHAYSFKGKILGISVDESAQWLQQRVADLVNETSQFLETNVKVDTGEILVNDQYIGDGYGIAGPRELEAIQLFARLEGVLLDPVYTGRAAAGLIDLLRSKADSCGCENLVLAYGWHAGLVRPALHRLLTGS